MSRERHFGKRVQSPGTGSMAAGRDIIGASTHVGDVYQSAPLPRADEVDPPPWSPPVLPPRTQMFVGRQSELAELDAALADPGGAVVHAVHGLGGVGKSALAAQWAHQHADAHTLTWWISADSAAAVTAGLAELAGTLVPELTRGAPAAVTLEDRAAWARRWLATHAGWLVVFDNVTHPSHVAELVSAAPGGRFLITSRLREGWYDFVPALIELEVLSASEARDLLARVVTAGRPDADLTGAAELCAELGHLPLAVKQAAAYMRRTHMSPEAYLRLLRDDPAVMYDQGADGQRTIARIWRLTLDHLAANGPLAGDLLRILAWWAPEGSPRSLLDPLGDAARLATALGDLAAYNMITLDADTVAVHRLVQAVARTPDPRPVEDDGDPHRRLDDIDHARDQATGLLNQARPTAFDDPAQWPGWQTLLPHITALADRTSPDTDTADTAQLLDWTATFLHNQGAVKRAVAYYQRVLAGRERVLGDDHPDTLTSRNNLAGAYQSTGDVKRAIRLYRQNMTDCARVLGDDHPSFLIARSNLAGAYQMAGDIGRAISLYEQTMADCARALGDDHPSTLLCRNNLAYAYQEANDVKRMVELSERNVVDCARVLGDDHPYTLTARGNLAGAYRAAGDASRAVRLSERTVADCERVLGSDHPYTLTFRNNLAAACQLAGDGERVVQLYERNMADCVRVLGDDHPSTLATRNNLAQTYQDAGEVERAIPLYERTMAGCERLLGNGHPDTLLVRNNLASAYNMAGDAGRAIKLFKRTVDDSERELGADHRITRMVQANLDAARAALRDSSIPSKRGRGGQTSRR